MENSAGKTLYVTLYNIEHCMISVCMCMWMQESEWIPKTEREATVQSVSDPTENVVLGIEES